MHADDWLAHGLSLALLLGCVGCGPVGEVEAEPTVPAETGQAPTNGPAPIVTVPVEVVVPVSPDEIAGSWWAMSPELPYIGFRLNLVAGATEQEFSGTWISFDWRGSSTEQDLFRSSRPVAIRAQLSNQQLVIRGPAPQLDSAGRPNGQRGTWTLVLPRVSLPGEPLKFSGRMIHVATDDDDRLTGNEGASVDLQRAYRAWAS